MYRPQVLTFLLLVLVAAATAGCDLFNNPNSPSTTAGNLDAFVGTWTSSSNVTPSATSCSNVRYTVSPVSPTTATVTFSATCAGNLQVNGNGSASLGASSLSWNAQGTVAQGGISCPFSFQNSTATLEAGGIRINYSGTVCGISISGSELLQKQR